MKKGKTEIYIKNYHDRELKIKEGVKNNKIIPMFKRWK
jgi:hypothetical protein